MFMTFCSAKNGPGYGSQSRTAKKQLFSKSGPIIEIFSFAIPRTRLPGMVGRAHNIQAQTPIMSEQYILPIQFFPIHQCVVLCTFAQYSYVERGGSYNRILFLVDSGCRDRAMLVLGPNTAKQAALAALLDPAPTSDHH